MDESLLITLGRFLGGFLRMNESSLFLTILGGDLGKMNGSSLNLTLFRGDVFGVEVVGAETIPERTRRDSED